MREIIKNKEDIYTDFLSNITLYSVNNVGYWHCDTLKLFLDKQDAIKYWEELTQLNYSQHDEYVQKRQTEHHSFAYMIMEENLWTFIENYANHQKETAIYQTQQNLSKDPVVKNLIEIELEKEFSKRMQGLIYYLYENKFLQSLNFGYSETKKLFWENTEKLKK